MFFSIWFLVNDPFLHLDLLHIYLPLVLSRRWKFFFLSSSPLDMYLDGYQPVWIDGLREFDKEIRVRLRETRKQESLCWRGPPTI
jgi:hypothetical protein